MYARATITKDGATYGIVTFPDADSFDRFKPEVYSLKGYEVAWEFECRDCGNLFPHDENRDRCEDCAPDDDEPMRVMGADSARAVGRFRAVGAMGYQAASAPNAPLRQTREEAMRDEREWLDAKSGAVA